MAERVNEEILLGRKTYISYNVAMYVVMTFIIVGQYDRTERINEEFSILPREKEISMSNCKSIVAVVFEC